MPTADSFTALGRGNGFPFCLTKKDVSGYAFVEPLTLQQVMNWRWNLYSASGLAISSDHGQQSSLPTLDTEPKNRACGFLDGQQNSTSQTRAKISTLGIGINKLYNGNTDNENNFIGYGIGSGDNISGVHNIIYLKAQSFTGFSELGIQSFSKIDTSGTSILFGTITFSTITLAGIPFVQYKRHQPSSGTGSSVSLDSAELYTY